jgi:hypothetical protein
MRSKCNVDGEPGWDDASNEKQVVEEHVGEEWKRSRHDVYLLTRILG